jgi:lysyl-tRNA synthetase class 2
VKRRQKQRDTEKKKAEKAAKAAALPDRPKKEKAAGANEEELNPNVCQSTSSAVSQSN